VLHAHVHVAGAPLTETALLLHSAAVLHTLQDG
jgi:hypothetical protein